MLSVSGGHWQLIEGTGSGRTHAGAWVDTENRTSLPSRNVSSACRIVQNANVFALLKSKGEADSIDECKWKVRLEREMEMKPKGNG